MLGQGSLGFTNQPRIIMRSIFKRCGAFTASGTPGYPERSRRMMDQGSSFCFALRANPVPSAIDSATLTGNPGETVTEEAKRAQDIAEAVDGYTATTIPVHVEIAMDQVVLNLQEAEKLLQETRSIALGPCECRTKNRRCDAPVDVCLTLNEASAQAVERESFRRVTVDEALATLRATHKAGLVHLAYRKPGLEATLFCSCCACCCWFLGTLKRFDFHDAVVASSHIAQHEVKRCVGCGVCVTRCPFEAWTQDSDLPTLHPERCFGCGLCVSTCPAGAIAFVPRPAVGSPGSAPGSGSTSVAPNGAA